MVVKSANTNPFINTKSAVTSSALPKMISVEGGEFLYGGASANCNVQLYGFSISETPVTQKQYLYVMNQNPSKLQGEDKPVEMVNWCEASPVWKRISCNFNANGYRLPTEAEWEYAARGGKNCDPYKYSGSSDINKVAWYGENSDITTHIVGTKAPNSLGLYDMCGNVMEWCWDYFENELPQGSQLNPHGPQIGNLHAKRGGSWLDDSMQCTIFFRSGSSPAGKSSSLGFRVCKTEFTAQI